MRRPSAYNLFVIGVLRYGIGNSTSILRMCKVSGIDARVVDYPEETAAVDRLILPGVGHFDSCVEALRQRGLDEIVRNFVQKEGKPVLGICVGAQILGRMSDEGNLHGLSILEHDTVRIDAPGLPIPHMSWEDVDVTDGSPFRDAFRSSPRFYFTHSYVLRAADPAAVSATFQYGGTLHAATHQGSVVAVQFHPEKSHRFGRELLAWYSEWNP